MSEQHKVEIDRIARVLMKAWEEAEGKPVNPSYVATFADMARAIIAGPMQEQGDRIRQEFAQIGAWRAGQSALVSATGGDYSVIGSILSQIRRQVIDGYVAALRCSPAGGEGRG